MEFQGHSVYNAHFYDITKLWFKYFGTVRKFTVQWIDDIPVKHQAFRVNDTLWPPGPPKSLGGAVKVANKRLKTVAVLEKEIIKAQGLVQASSSRVGEFGLPTPDLKEEEVEMWTWTWEAEGDGVLGWDSSRMDNRTPSK
jgi:hypothetical protein